MPGCKAQLALLEEVPGAWLPAAIHSACSRHAPSIPQGVDWRHPAMQKRACNGGFNPLSNSWNDGVNVDPLEAMFIKVGPSAPSMLWSRRCCPCCAFSGIQTVVLSLHMLTPPLPALPCLLPESAGQAEVPGQRLAGGGVDRQICAVGAPHRRGGRAEQAGPEAHQGLAGRPASQQLEAAPDVRAAGAACGLAQGWCRGALNDGAVGVPVRLPTCRFLIPIPCPLLCPYRLQAFMRDGEC